AEQQRDRVVPGPGGRDRVAPVALGQRVLLRRPRGGDGVHRANCLRREGNRRGDKNAPSVPDRDADVHCYAHRAGGSWESVREGGQFMNRGSVAAVMLAFALSGTAASAQGLERARKPEEAGL